MFLSKTTMNILQTILAIAAVLFTLVVLVSFVRFRSAAVPVPALRKPRRR